MGQKRSDDDGERTMGGRPAGGGGSQEGWRPQRHRGSKNNPTNDPTSGSTSFHFFASSSSSQSSSSAAAAVAAAAAGGAAATALGGTPLTPRAAVDAAAGGLCAATAALGAEAAAGPERRLSRPSWSSPPTGLCALAGWAGLSLAEVVGAPFCDCWCGGSGAVLCPGCCCAVAPAGRNVVAARGSSDCTGVGGGAGLSSSPSVSNGSSRKISYRGRVSSALPRASGGRGEDPPTQLAADPREEEGKRSLQPRAGVVGEEVIYGRPRPSRPELRNVRSVAPPFLLESHVRRAGVRTHPRPPRSSLGRDATAPRKLPERTAAQRRTIALSRAAARWRESGKDWKRPGVVLGCPAQRQDRRACILQKLLKVRPRRDGTRSGVLALVRVLRG